MEKKIIYLDNAATTPMYPEAVEAMMPYFTERFGNPSSQYSLANEGKRAIESARKQIAATIGARPEEIYFTGSGTEADNWAIKMAAKTYGDKGRHIITTKIEHHAVLHTCEALERDGYRVTYLSPDEEGIISPESLLRVLTPDTILVSIMTANNEIGTIEPIDELAKIVTERGILFHTDAVQAYGKLPLSVEDGNIAMMSASAHKIGGPKGVGFLYVRRDVRLSSFLHATGFEGKSIAIQEAQTLKKPILATDCSGNREQIIDGIDGRLCQLSPEAVSEQLLWMIRHPKECRLYGEAAGKRVLYHTKGLEEFLALLDAPTDEREKNHESFDYYTSV